jgi:hypothetical protein
MRYRFNSPPVVAETLDGEATIVDLDSGTYYALNQSGSLIWEELGRGAEAGDIAETLASTYGLESNEAEAAVEELTTRLSELSLIVPLDGAAIDPEPAKSNGHLIADYAPPELSTFTDMQELLLLDPVHEVDESGWPTSAKPASS